MREKEKKRVGDRQKGKRERDNQRDREVGSEKIAQLFRPDFFALYRSGNSSFYDKGL